MENKRHKDFNVADVPLELCLLQTEIAEFFRAWRHQQPDMGEELADVAIYVLGLAEIVGIDLEAEVEAKMVKNAGRQYIRRNGVPVKANEIAPA